MCANCALTCFVKRGTLADALCFHIETTRSSDYMGRHFTVCKHEDWKAWRTKRYRIAFYRIHRDDYGQIRYRLEHIAAVICKVARSAKDHKANKVCVVTLDIISIGKGIGLALERINSCPKVHGRNILLSQFKCRSVILGLEKLEKLNGRSRLQLFSHELTLLTFYSFGFVLPKKLVGFRSSCALVIFDFHVQNSLLLFCSSQAFHSLTRHYDRPMLFEDLTLPAKIAEPNWNKILIKITQKRRFTTVCLKFGIKPKSHFKIKFLVFLPNTSIG